MVAEQCKGVCLHVDFSEFVFAVMNRCRVQCASLKWRKGVSTVKALGKSVYLNEVINELYIDSI